MSLDLSKFRQLGKEIEAKTTEINLRILRSGAFLSMGAKAIIDSDIIEIMVNEADKQILIIAVPKQSKESIKLQKGKINRASFSRFVYDLADMKFPTKHEPDTQQKIQGKKIPEGLLFDVKTITPCDKGKGRTPSKT